MGFNGSVVCGSEISKLVSSSWRSSEATQIDELAPETIVDSYDLSKFSFNDGNLFLINKLKKQGYVSCPAGQAKCQKTNDFN
jgi:hypothetical protein